MTFSSVISSPIVTLIPAPSLFPFSLHDALPISVEFAERNGYELSGHRTRLLEPGACREGDLLVGMEPKHVGTIQQQGLAGPAQLTLLGLWHPSRPSAYIHDPYMASDRFFERCEQYVVEATLQLIESAHRAQKAWRPSTPST